MSAIICDVLIDMNVADADGTGLTPTILLNGTQGPNNAWTVTGTGLSVQSAGNDRLDQVYLRGSGTNFATGATHRRIALDDSLSFSYAVLSAPTEAHNIPLTQIASTGGLLTLGADDAGAGGAFFDLVTLGNQSGDGAVLQLATGRGVGGSPGYALNVESNPGGVTTHSTYYTVTPGSQHWYSFQVDWNLHTFELYLYDIDGDQEFNVTGSIATTTTGFSNLRIGNAEAGTSTGTTYFENLTLDYTKAASPLGPIGPGTYFIPKFTSGGGANPPGTGAATTITTQLSNVAAGDIIAVIAKWEGGDGVGISCSDGTSSFSVGSVAGTTGQTNAGGDPRSAIFYLEASVASGTVTYTVTIGASRTFRDLVVFAVTPPTGTAPPLLDGTNTGNTSTGATAVTSTNQTTDGPQGISFGLYAEFGAIMRFALINGAHPDGARASLVGNGVGWCAAYSAGFTGAATGTCADGTHKWNAQILSFKVPPNPLNVFTGEPNVGAPSPIH